MRRRGLQREGIRGVSWKWWVKGCGMFLCGSLFLLLAGCDSGSSNGTAPDGGSLLVDTAGVLRLESTEPRWDELTRWRVDSLSTLAIGEVEGDSDYLFGSIVGLHRLEDGVIVAVDRQARDVRFFDAQGRFVRRVAGPGDGPGELSQLPDGVFRCGGDDIYVHDRGGQRIQIWARDGALLDDRPFHFTVPEQGGERPPFRWDCSPAGGIVFALLTQVLPESSGFFADVASVYVKPPGSEGLVDLGPFVVAERLIVLEQGGGSIFVHPFGRALHFAADDEHVYLAPGARMEVLIFDWEGDLVRYVSGPSREEDLRMPSDVLRRYREAELSFRDSLVVARIEPMGLELPPAFPATRQVLVDPRGNLWVERFRPPWDPSPMWAVFGDSGSYLGDVEMPRGVTVYQVGTDFVLGVSADAAGVERIVLHALERPD